MATTRLTCFTALLVVLELSVLQDVTGRSIGLHQQYERDVQHVAQLSEQATETKLSDEDVPQIQQEAAVKRLPRVNGDHNPQAAVVEDQLKRPLEEEYSNDDEGKALLDVAASVKQFQAPAENQLKAPIKDDVKQPAVENKKDKAAGPAARQVPAGSGSSSGNQASTSWDASSSEYARPGSQALDDAIDEVNNLNNQMSSQGDASSGTSGQANTGTGAAGAGASATGTGTGTGTSGIGTGTSGTGTGTANSGSSPGGGSVASSADDASNAEAENKRDAQ